MAFTRPSNSFKNKQNVNPSINRITEATAEDFQEAGQLFDAIAQWIDSQVQPEGFYKFHVSLAVLQAAYPNAPEGSFAIIVPNNGNTPFIAIVENGVWVATENQAPIQYSDNKVALEANDGQADIFYIVKDEKLIGLWYNNKYNYFGKDGDNGLSAYEVAQALGFTGTKQEWLDSLVGKSAYEVAVAGGFEGTQPEWIETLGGIPGKSTYQVWLDADNEGSQEDFFLSLKGPDGKSAYQSWLDDGNQGTPADFIQSLQGNPGDPGKSAYQVWLLQGNQGTEQEFLESLKGPAGDVTAQQLTTAKQEAIDAANAYTNLQTANSAPIKVESSRNLAATDKGRKLYITANCTLTYPTAGLGADFECNMVTAPTITANVAGTTLLATTGTILLENKMGHCFVELVNSKLSLNGGFSE